MAAARAPRPRSPAPPSRRTPGEAGAPRLVDQLCSSWAALLLGLLRAGPGRYASLLHALPPVSHKVLTENLRRLERDGLLTRTQTGQRPLAVEYALTPVGVELAGLLADVRDWAAGHEADVRAAQATYDEAHAAGSSLPSPAEPAGPPRAGAGRRLISR